MQPQVGSKNAVNNMSRPRRRTTSDDTIFSSEWAVPEIDNEAPLTLLGAVCQVVEVARNSRNDARIYEVAARPLAYIVDLLMLTPQQAVVYALVMDIYYDTLISTYDLARCLNISPLNAMAFGGDLEELCRRGYIVENNESGTVNKSYSVTREAITSLEQDCAISYRKSCVASAEEWFVAFDKLITSRCNEHIDYDTLCCRVEELVAKNTKLNMVKSFEAKCGKLSTDDKMLLLWVCNMVVTSGYDSMVPENFRKLYGDYALYRTQRKSLIMGTNSLIKQGLLRLSRANEQRSRDCFELTPWVVKEMLAELDLSFNVTTVKELLDHTSIVAKRLYYNEREQRAIDQLAALLQPARFTEVRAELQRQGFRSGFACLFHGAPGTGKTETVLQLARATRRDIMQVNIAEIKSMWVGESEKNIKAVFTRYRRLVEESEVAPILLFNEADAIIGKRFDNVQRSTDKMENTMQNIILEEIERLDGILIATTNLTCNMDKAFERRFLYKVEFAKPSEEAKCAIWQSMIEGLSREDAVALAARYDFSGGQIENVARKSIVDRILTGDDLSLDRLCSHCDAELIDNGTNRQRIGF